jgi:hypothetical protein
MSDPPRLTRDPNSGLAGALIESARDDAPPRSSRQRALLAVGAGGGALLAASAAKGGAALAAGAAASGSAGSAGTSSGTVAAWGVVAKWIGGSAVAAVVTAGAMGKIDVPHPFARANVTQAPRQAPAPPTARALRTVETKEAETMPDVPVAPPPLPEPERIQVAPVKASAREPIAQPANESAARRPQTSNLVGEIATLDRAREAVAGGAFDRAFAAIDEYDRRFPAGTLSLESQVLRVEALAQRGDRDRAARLAEAFLAQHPSSAHTARVRSLLLSIRKDRAP